MRADDRARVSMVVRVPPAVAFRAFTEDVDQWWRRGQRFRFAARHGSVVHIEGGVGGRLFESFETSGHPGAARVVACGAITAWDPPHRFAFEWRSPNYAADEKTFVDVLFEESASGTLVTVTHCGWSALGDDHPVRHGESAAVFLRRTGRWWADQMTSLRLHLETRDERSRRMKNLVNVVLAAVAGFFAWWIVATALDRALRLAWPEYAVAVPTLTFTLAMLLARLVEGAVCTLAAGAVAAWIGKRSSPRRAAVAMAALLLLFFVPTHAMIWSHFPVWYHLTFLGSLAPLTLLGARLVPLAR